MVSKGLKLNSGEKDLLCLFQMWNCESERMILKDRDDTRMIIKQKNKAEQNS